MDEEQSTANNQPSKFTHFAMIACCAVMLIPIGGYLLAGRTLTGLGSNLTAFAPIILCVGAHIFMHKAMGKKCHGSKKQNDGKVQTPATLPEIQRAESSIPQVVRH